jgi:hypothetical protein
MRETLLFLSVVFIFVSSARADWINFSGAENAPNIAEIYINDDHIRVNMEIFINDITTFHRLVPDDFFKGKDIKRSPMTERMRNFSNEDFQFVTGKGEKLQAEVKLVEPRMRKERPSPFVGVINPMTRRPVPGPPEDKRVLYAEFIYPFKTKPEQLTIVPPLDKRGAGAVSLGFTAYHMEVPLVGFKYLSRASGLNLNWDDPWYSAFEDRALKRWQQSGVRSFIYIEPYEVRHEVLVRVKDLAQWMDLELRGNDFIEEDEFDALRQRAGEFFLKRDRVIIDGKSFRPILDRTSFVKYSMTQTRFISVPERMPTATAMLGIIITYLTDGIPQEVSVEWDFFSERIQRVPTSAVDPAGPFPSYVTPDDNVHVWKNFLKQYKIPTVEGVAVADSVTSMHIPAGSVLCVAFLLPVAWRTRKRRQNNKPVKMQAGVIALLIAGSLLMYPYVKVSVAKPGSFASRISNENAKLILHSLLKNVYRAFDFREEEDVYDKLAISASGDILTDIYLQNRKSFKVKRAGGAQARVKEVEILDVVINSNEEKTRALDLKAKWTAMGTVGHWGHIHTRQNWYDAVVTIEPVDGSWKITGLELLEEKRIDPYAKNRDQ